MTNGEKIEEMTGRKPFIDDFGSPYMIFSKAWWGAEYKEREPKGEWIPVKERLPEEDGVYLVTLEYVEDSEIVNEIDMAKFVSSEKDDCNDGFHKAYPVIAWRPLPEVYMGEL